MPLDLSSLERALDAFEAVQAEVDDASAMAALRPNQRLAIEAGVIQHFEFTYELCWKMLQRWLGDNLGQNEVEGVSRRQLFRLAAEHRLIEDVDEWMVFHRARNTTSHAYGAQVAKAILAVSREFGPKARQLLRAIDGKNDGA